MEQAVSVIKRRVDQNHGDIVKELRSYPGCTCFSTAALGSGIPDLCIGYQGVTVLAEVKSGRGKLNTYQKAFHEAWCGSTILVLRTQDDVANLLNHMDRMRRVFGRIPGQDIDLDHEGG